jgi:hypothetical protein
MVDAEDLTGRFYCIPGREWPRYAYEMSSLAQDPGPEAPVFADLVRMVPADGAAARGPVSELYRIRLRDDAILSAVHRGDGVSLYPLMLYVLTHELIHVVRFRTGAASFDAEPAQRKGEETRVHVITREVLRAPDDPELTRVLELYRLARLAGDVCGGFSPK